MQPDQSDGMEEYLDPHLLRCYISLAREQKPYIPAHLTEYICAHYVSLRNKEAEAMEGQVYVTPRTLMSILRLSQVG